MEEIKCGAKPETVTKLSGLLRTMSKLSEGPVGAIGLMEDPRWTLIHSLVK